MPMPAEAPLNERIVREIERSEIAFATDRMTAIKERPGNPEGVEIARIGGAVCLYSRTMPWPSFNTVKGLRDEDAARLDEIAAFYRERDRNVQFEIVPGLIGPDLLKALAGRGLYPSGFHASMYGRPGTGSDAAAGDSEARSRDGSGTGAMDSAGDPLRIVELGQDDFETYATIHCRAFGLPDNGIPHVAANNRVLHARPGWTFYLAYWDGAPAATAVMHAAEGTASFTFAATLPEFRGRGIHRRLLLHRLAAAAERGCTLAVGQCAFLSASHRNMERAGMRLGYVRTTWTKREP